MKELFEKEGHSIFSFKKGDIIIKLKPRMITKDVENENLMITTKVVVGIDNSFRQPLEFVAIENNQIYLRDVIKDRFLEKKYVRIANLEDHLEDWALFVLPEGLKIEDCVS